MRFFWIGAAALLLLVSCEAKFDWPWLKNEAHQSGKTVTEDRTIGAFDRVRLDGVGKLFFDAAVPAGTIRITADEGIIPSIRTAVEGSRLKIDEEGLHMGQWDIEFRVAPPAALSEISLDGMGSIETTERLKLAELNVSLNGMGKISLEVDAAGIKAEQDGQGELSVRGKAGKVVINADGLGRVDASGLITTNADVQSNGLGEVSVYASETLKVRANGVGAVNFFGRPKTTDVQTEGLTKVKAAD